MVSTVSGQGRELGRVLAAELLKREAIKVNLDDPFVLASGNRSPIYINCRQLISFPATVKLIVAAASLHLELRNCQYDVVAGGETAGIPFAAFFADCVGKPMIYVRKTPKGHGTASQIEGILAHGSRVLLIEDLITDGLSKVGFITAIRDAGGQVEDVMVILDRLQGGEPVLNGLGVCLTALTNIDLVLEVAAEWALLSPESLNSVHNYLRSPAEWHAKRGLSYRG